MSCFDYSNFFVFVRVPRALRFLKFNYLRSFYLIVQLVLWVINPISTQLKGYQPKIKQPGCLSRLITPWVNNPNKQPGLLKIRVTTQKPKNL